MSAPTLQAIAADKAALAHYKATHAAALPEEPQLPASLDAWLKQDTKEIK